MGTNSARLLIGRVEDSWVRRVHFEMETTRIGAGTASTGELKEAGVEKTLEVLRRYRAVLERWGAINARAVATSAVREASNGREFARLASLALGFPLEVISGEEEAYLSYVGVASGLPKIERPLVLDIGGGSSELIWMGERGVEAHSLPVGAVGLSEDASRIKTLEDWDWLFAELSRRDELTLVGVGGTATTLAAVELRMEYYDPDLVQAYEIEISRVERIYQELSALSLEERRRVPGVQPSRADIILEGIQILLEIMRRSGRKRLVVAESDLLYGILYETLSTQR